MSRATGPIVRAIAPAALAVFLLTGCARSIVEEHRYGSIKDTPSGPRVASYARQEPASPKLVRPAKAAKDAPPALPAGTTPAATTPGARAGIVQAPPTAPEPKASERAADSPAPVLGPVSAQAQAEASRRLLTEGERLFAAGEVVKARERFLAAMNGPIPEVMLAFGRSFDPYYLARLPRSNAAPDAQRAITIYEGAVRQGSADAEADLQRLRKSVATSPAGTPIAPKSPPVTPPAAGQAAPASSAPAPAAQPTAPPTPQIGTPATPAPPKQ